MTCCQAWQSEVDPLEPHDIRREMTPARGQHICTYTQITVTLDILILDIFKSENK